MMKGLEAQVCMLPGGFQSYAPAFETDGCEPGFVPKGCKATRRMFHTLGVGATAILRVDPFQPLKVGAIVNINSDVDVLIDDMQVDKQSLFPRVEDEAVDFVDGLGLVVDLTPELYRSGLNPLPPQPAIDKTDPMQLTISSVLGGDFDVFIYFVNP